MLTPSAERHGYMTEALKNGFIPYAKGAIQKNNLACTSIHAPIDPENGRSIKLVTNIGMQHEQSKDYYSDSFNRPRSWYTLNLENL